MSKLRVALCQSSPRWEDKSANMKLIDTLLAEENPQCDLLVFPEMTLTGFSMRPETLAEQGDGETMDYFAGIALRNSCDVIFGNIASEGGRFYNELVYCGKNGIREAAYRKMHLFSYANEHEHYTAGKQPVIVEKGGFKIGLSICYDLRFPELFRSYALRAADLIINIANWPTPRAAAWELLLRARALENLAYVAAVNRTGDDPFVQYSGRSAVIGPLGDTLRTSPAENSFVQVELDTEVITQTRSKFPFLKDIKFTDFR